jgi:hypothetical protein
MDTPMPPATNVGRVTFGLIILTLGLLMLVNRAGDFGVDAMLLFPGVVLIAMGLVRMALAAQEPEAHRGPNPIVHGLWLMTVGTWLILNLLHLFGMTFGTSWPLLMIAGGAFIVARAWET